MGWVRLSQVTCPVSRRAIWGDTMMIAEYHFLGGNQVAVPGNKARPAKQ